MNPVAVILMGLAMAAVLFSLVIGMYFMTQPGDENRKKSNLWMRRRVMLQGAAIALFALAILMGGH